MSKNKEIKLRNVIFPIWLLWIFPITWIIIIPTNILIDSLVVVLGLKFLKLNNIKELYKKSIVRVVIFGFISDIIGSFVMLLPNLIEGIIKDKVVKSWLYDNMINSVNYRPLDNIYSFLWTTMALIISAFFIYFFNKKVSFKSLDIDDQLKKRLSIILAVFTAPYVFYLPTSWFIY